METKKKERASKAKTAGQGVADSKKEVDAASTNIVVGSPKKGFRTHGRTFTGRVISDKMSRTVTVAWERRHYVKKYQRYERRYSKVKAHNPPEMDAKAGDKVTIMETRPISKTKHFIVIKKHE